MKNIIICTIAALALAGGITQPSVALDDPAPETAAAPVAEEESPTPETSEAPAAEEESPAPEATDAPVAEDDGESELSEAEQAERDSITEGLICHMEGWVEACRAPDLIDMGLAPLPDGTPVTVVTEEQVQELKPAKVKRPGVPKTGY